jgi:hypothetical protein
MSIRNTKNPKEIPPELLELYAKNNPHDLLTKTVLSDLEIATFYLKTHIPKHLKGKLDVKNLDVELYRGMMVLFLMSLIMKLVHRDDFLEQLLEYSQEMSWLFEKHDVYFHQFMVYIISYRKGEGMRDVKKIVDTTVQPYQLDPESILAGVFREREEMIKQGKEEGIEQGKSAKQKEVILSMHAKQLSVDFIAEIVNLPQEEVLQIIQSSENNT